MNLLDVRDGSLCVLLDKPHSYSRRWLAIKDCCTLQCILY